MEGACRSPRPPGAGRWSLFGASGILLLLVSGCNIPANRPPTPTPVVVTVVVTAPKEATPSEPPTTEVPATVETQDVLPTPTFTPLPRPAPPSTSAQVPDGSDMENFRIKMDFNPYYFLRVYVFYSEDAGEQFRAKKDGRGIDSVDFSVTSTDGATTYLQKTEHTSGYCAFGGGEPDCNPWLFEDGQYRWTSGGPPVESGAYNLTVTVNPDNGGVAGSWRWGDDSGNPIEITAP